jgi:hypothetical protein
MLSCPVPTLLPILACLDYPIAGQVGQDMLRQEQSLQRPTEMLRGLITKSVETKSPECAGVDPGRGAVHTSRRLLITSRFVDHDERLQADAELS